MTLVLAIYGAYIFAVPFLLSTGYWILVWHRLNRRLTDE